MKEGIKGGRKHSMSATVIALLLMTPIVILILQWALMKVNEAEYHLITPSQGIECVVVDSGNVDCWKVGE